MAFEEIVRFCPHAAEATKNANPITIECRMRFL
jgi:hypothetical protein